MFFAPLLACIVLIVWLFKPIRIVHVHGCLGSIVWSARSWLRNYPVTEDYNVWNEGDPNDMEAWKKHRIRVIQAWCFLHPFFASRGYDCYIPEDPQDFCCSLLPRTKSADSSQPTPPQAARYCCKHDEQAKFLFMVSAMILPNREG
jgi:hypothetical protein